MQRQLRLNRANLLAVAVSHDRHSTVGVAKLRRFQKCKRRNALARSKFKSVGNQRIVLVAANLDFVGIALAIVRELSLHVGCPDNSIQMSRSNNRKLTSCDDSVELLLGFAQSADIVKDDLSLFVLLCALGDSGFDRVNHGEEMCIRDRS